MRHDEKSEQQARQQQQQQQRLLTTDCDQCQLIVATTCCPATGRRFQQATSVTENTDDLVESSKHCPRRSEQSGDIFERWCCPQAVGSRPRAGHSKSTTMIIDNLVNDAVRRCYRPLSLALAASALLLLLSMATPTPALFLSPLEAKFLDSSCNSRGATHARSNAYQILLILRCDIVPLFDRYLATYHKDESKDVISKHPVAGGEFAEFRKNIEQFFQTAEQVISLHEFCSWNTFSKLSAMKAVVKNSNLLKLAYDLVAIELHTSCIGQTISRLPPVPHLVKDIVKIYIDGADKPLLDLNSEAQDEMEDDTPFDVDAALKRSGSLEDVVGLSLTMFGRPGSNQEKAQEFRTTCKNFLIGIEECWDTMEIMNSQVETDGSAIRQVNNYTLRNLAPTKFADICSKISERA